jgi:acetylornithine/N-succinyldiaminopimelate aminotransferase
MNMNENYEALKQREEKVMFRTYGRYPLAVARAEGTRLYDLDGREYVDLLAGIAVVNLGHCRPELTEAVAEQMQRLVHVSNLFYQEEQVALGERLLATCAADRVFLCNSGAEANEAAVKLARRYMQLVRGRDAFEILTLDQSFHGRTLAMVAATGQEPLRKGYNPMPEGFDTVPWNDLETLEKRIGPQTAGVMVELVQGESGVRPMSREYALGIAELCRKKDVLFIVDEIQTGLCRTGSFWAHQRFGLEPDIFTSAKGLANGLPIGAMLAKEEVAQGFVPGAHGTTFGGGPVLSVVASKVVDLLLEENLAGRAQEMGEYALGLFRDIQAAHPDKIADVRGVGLMLGIELVSPGQDVWRALLDKGFVLNLAKERVLRLLPPLTIAKEDLEAFARALDDVLSGK